MTDGKVVLVTGGSRGIGRQTVRELSRAGLRVFFTGRSEQSCQHALIELGLPAAAVDCRVLDVSDNDGVQALADYVRSCGGLDILINNAGINYDSWQRAAAVDISEVEQTLDVNLLGPWRLCNAFIPLLRAGGGGRIINVSSSLGAIASQDGSTPAYSLSKCALNMLTRSLAADLQGSSITVNAVCPGWVRTELGGPTAPRSVEEGADTIVWLATRTENDLTGTFFRDRRPIPW